MVKVIASQTLAYGRHRYAAGEEVEVSEKDARLLIAIKRAVPAKPPVQAAPTTLVFKAVEPDAPPEVEAAPEAPSHPPIYSRRDMTAEPAGQTGQAVSSPSLHRGRPRGPKT